MVPSLCGLVEFAGEVGMTHEAAPGSFHPAKRQEKAETALDLLWRPQALRQEHRHGLAGQLSVVPFELVKRRVQLSDGLDREQLGRVAFASGKEHHQIHLTDDGFPTGIPVLASPHLFNDFTKNGSTDAATRDQLLQFFLGQTRIQRSHEQCGNESLGDPLLRLTVNIRH
jgi:hypothetical protein